MTAGIVLYFGDMLACTIAKVSGIIPSVIILPGKIGCTHVLLVFF